MKLKSFKLIIIEGRRWFQKTYGNTYHTVTVTVKHARKPDVTLKSAQQYGYGDTYRQTAAAMLSEYFANYQDMCDVMRSDRERFYITCHDVSRERDL